MPKKKINKFGFSWSWKRALGISQLRSKISRKIGIPTTRDGIERKIGHFLVEFIIQQLTKEDTGKENKKVD